FSGSGRAIYGMGSNGIDGSNDGFSRARGCFQWWWKWDPITGRLSGGKRNYILSGKREYSKHPKEHGLEPHKRTRIL
ncbi:MAG: hypothetical protein KAH30_04970, partial [Caldisericia bacterium]|nr:hypothetical protein [Caldisericia bacterium]